MENNLFDIDKINEQISFFNENLSKHYIGIYDDGVVFCYTLMLHFGDVKTLILSKQYIGSDKKHKFNEEVSNICEYFNAEIVSENGGSFDFKVAYSKKLT